MGPEVRQAAALAQLAAAAVAWVSEAHSYSWLEYCKIKNPPSIHLQVDWCTLRTYSMYYNSSTCA